MEDLYTKSFETDKIGVTNESYYMLMGCKNIINAVHPTQGSVRFRRVNAILLTMSVVFFFFLTK